MWATALQASAAQGADNSQAPLQTHGIQISGDEAGSVCFHRFVCTLKVEQHCLRMSTMVISTGELGEIFSLLLFKVFTVNIYHSYERKVIRKKRTVLFHSMLGMVSRYKYKQNKAPLVRNFKLSNK